MFTGLIRTIILYILIIAGVRLMGKRQVGELEPSELVLSLIIADLASVPMQDYGIPLLTGVVPILTLLAVTMILSVLTMKSVRFRALLCGRPSMVIQNGTLVQGEMAKTRLTVDELLEELRIKGYTDISQIKYAILETNGQLSVLPCANQKPPTARDLKVSVEEAGLPRGVISDGKLLERNLKALGHDRPWLDKQLSQRGCRDLSKVFLLLVDEADAVYFAEKELYGRIWDETTLYRGGTAGPAAGGQPGQRLVRPGDGRRNAGPAGAGPGPDPARGLGAGGGPHPSDLPGLAGPPLLFPHPDAAQRHRPGAAGLPPGAGVRPAPGARPVQRRQRRPDGPAGAAGGDGAGHHCKRALRACLISQGMPNDKEFCRQTRQIFAGILDVLQEKLYKIAVLLPQSPPAAVPAPSLREP